MGSTCPPRDEEAAENQSGQRICSGPQAGRKGRADLGVGAARQPADSPPPDPSVAVCRGAAAHASHAGSPGSVAGNTGSPEHRRG